MYVVLWLPHLSSGNITKGFPGGVGNRTHSHRVTWLSLERYRYRNVCYFSRPIRCCCCCCCCCCCYAKIVVDVMWMWDVISVLTLSRRTILCIYRCVRHFVISSREQIDGTIIASITIHVSRLTSVHNCYLVSKLSLSIIIHKQLLQQFRRRKGEIICRSLMTWY